MERDNTQDKKIIVLETNYKTMSEKIDDLKTIVNKGFSDIKTEFYTMRIENDRKYVSQEKFEPVRMIAYGLVALVLMAVVGAIIKGVVPLS